jgi:hypothetical protein
MTRTVPIHRHADGSIDIGSYRVGITALRGQAIRDATTLCKGFAGVLVTAVVLGVVTFLAAMPRSNTSLVATAPAVSHPIR